jgi:GT2 family glycosyltransferase
MNLGAYITTLNRPQLLEKTLQIMRSQTTPPRHVLVVDNAGSGETRRVVASFPSAWATYQAMGDNVGPAGAGAYALDRLGRDGYEWIYCGDDDDPPQSPDTLERLLAVAEGAGETVGAVGAVGARWDWDVGTIRRLPDEALHGVIDVDVIGGNGQLIVRRDVLAKVGLPDSRLFFGLDDVDYCLRIRTAGYRILVEGDLMRACRTRAGRLNLQRQTSLVPRHSYDTIWRQYYSTRNYIFTMTRTFGHPRLARRELFKAMGRACFSWGRGVRYGSAFTAMQLRGIVDGYVGHMGRTVLPTPKYAATAPRPPS